MILLPWVQHMPSLAHLPVFFRQNEFPAMQGSRSWKNPSLMHLVVSGVPMRQPKGPQQMLGPKHCPECPGPQVTH